MIISLRYGIATCMLLAFALVPTVIHSYSGLTIDDGLRAAAVPEDLADMRSQPTGRKARWAQETLAAHDFIERIYRSSSGEVQLFVGRSYDAKRLYHHPELAILRGTTTTPAGRAALPGRSGITVHLLTTSRGGRQGIAAYALLYDGQYVERPILFQARIAGLLLFSGRKPMTLFLASDLSGSLDRIEQAPSVGVLGSAIQAFEAQRPGTVEN